MKTQIVPAILAQTPAEFKKKLNFFQPFFSLIQIDVLNKTMGIKNRSFFDLAKIKAMRPRAGFELHLMVDQPEEIYRPWLRYSGLKRVIVHYESFHKRKKELYDTIKEIKRAKKQFGIAINPNTPISKILEFLPMVDEVLILGVHPGWSGQKMVVSALKKAQQIRSHYPRLNIGFDGGVTMDNIRNVIESGANVICAASLFNKFAHEPAQIKKTISNIKKIRP